MLFDIYQLINSSINFTKHHTHNISLCMHGQLVISYDRHIHDSIKKSRYTCYYPMISQKKMLLSYDRHIHDSINSANRLSKQHKHLKLEYYLSKSINITNKYHGNSTFVLCYSLFSLLNTAFACKILQAKNLRLQITPWSNEVTTHW